MTEQELLNITPSKFKKLLRRLKIMNYDKGITDLVEAIKADKSIIQPWRNKATARLEEAQAFVRMGKTITRINPENVYNANYTMPDFCTCPFDNVVDKNCNVHGGTK